MAIAHEQKYGGFTLHLRYWRPILPMRSTRPPYARHALVAAANIEDVGEPAVLLLVGDAMLPWTLLPVPVGPRISRSAHAVHIHVLERTASVCASRRVQVFRCRGLRNTDDRDWGANLWTAARVILRQPHREDVELAIAGKHGIEGREIAERLFHDLRPRIDEDAMHGGGLPRNSSTLARGHKKAKRESPCAFLSSERMTSPRSSTCVFAAPRSGPGFKRRRIAPAMTRVSTPTLKNDMNFSWASISPLAAAVDLGPRSSQDACRNRAP